MIYAAIKGLSKSLPRIIFGTLALREADEKTFSLLDSVKQMGCYALDTARAYGDGVTEQVIGKWMEARNNRSEIIVIDKGAHPIGGENRVEPEYIREDLRESLRQLRTDYIDLYLLHRDDPSVPVDPIIEVLNDLKAQGKVVLFGASNWSRERLEEAGEYADSKGLQSFSVSSNQFSLAIQYDNPYPGTLSIKNSAEDPELEWYRKSQFPLLAWSSLARGFFSGKFNRDNLTDFSDQQSLISIRCYAREDNFVRLERTRMLAEEKGATVPQIALAHIFHQSVNCFAITGSSNPVHFRESVAALEIELTAREVDWLDLKTGYPD